MKKNDSLSNWNCLMPIVTILIVFLNQVLSVKIPDVVLIGLCVVSFFVLPISAIYSYVAFAFLFDQWIPIYMIAFIAGIILLLRKGFQIQKAQCYYWALGFIIIGAISIIVEELDIIIYLKDSVSLLFLLYLFINVKDEKKGSVVALWYMIGFVSMGVLSLVIVSKYMNLSDAIRLHRFGYDSLRYYLPSGVRIANENNIGRWAAIVTVLALLQKYRELIRIEFTVFMCVFAGILALLTQSRSGIGVIVLAYILIFLFLGQKLTVEKKFGIIFGSVVLLVIIYLLVMKYTPHLLNRFISRFDTNDLSNGRIDIFKSYHESWTSKTKWVLWGAGKQDVGDRLEVGTSCHNAIQGYLVCYGITGTCFVFGIISSLINEMFEPCKVKLAYITPFIVWFVAKLSGSMDTAEMLLIISLSSLGFDYIPSDDKHG